MKKRFKVKDIRSETMLLLEGPVVPSVEKAPPQTVGGWRRQETRTPHLKASEDTRSTDTAPPLFNGCQVSMLLPAVKVSGIPPQPSGVAPATPAIVAFPHFMSYSTDSTKLFILVQHCHRLPRMASAST